MLTNNNKYIFFAKFIVIYINIYQFLIIIMIMKISVKSKNFLSVYKMLMNNKKKCMFFLNKIKHLFSNINNIYK